MCFDAPDPPQTDPRQWQALDRQASLNEEGLQFAKDAYREGVDRQNKLDEYNKKFTDMQYAQAEKNIGRSDEAYDYFMKTGRPAIQRVMDEASTYDNANELARVRGKATADVEQAFSSGMGAINRNLGRLGGPTGGRSLAAMGDMASQLALAKVTAANQAVEQRRAGGINLRTNAANMANGIPGQAIALGGAGTSAGTSAAQIGQMGMNSVMGLNGQMGGAFGTAAGGAGAVAGGYGQLYNQQLAGANFSANNDPFQKMLGAAAGVGSAWAIGKVS